MKHKIIQHEDDLHNLSETNVFDTFTKIISLFHFDLIFLMVEKHVLLQNHTLIHSFFIRCKKVTKELKAM